MAAAQLLEFGPDLDSGTALMDYASFTTRIGIHSGVHATRSLRAAALPDSARVATGVPATSNLDLVDTTSVRSKFEVAGTPVATRVARHKLSSQPAAGTI